MVTPEWKVDPHHGATAHAGQLLPRHIPKTVGVSLDAKVYVSKDPIHTLSKRWLSLWYPTANTSSYPATMMESVSTLLKRAHDSRSHLHFTFLNTLTSL